MIHTAIKAHPIHGKCLFAHNGVIEVGIPSMANLYMTEVGGPGYVGGAVAGAVVAAYWFCMMIGRLVGGAIGGAIAGRLMGRIDVTWLRWIVVAFLFYDNNLCAVAVCENDHASLVRERADEGQLFLF